jgi:ATP-dependent DNA helicase RecQ
MKLGKKKNYFPRSKYLENQNQLKETNLNQYCITLSEEKSLQKQIDFELFWRKNKLRCICSFTYYKKAKKTDSSSLSKEIISLLKIADLTERVKIKHKKSDDIIFVLQQLLENERILIKPNNTLKL